MSSFICAHCQKSYKSQVWFNKHTMSCAPAPEVQAPVIQVEVPAPVIQVEVPAQVETPVEAPAPVQVMASNLKTEQFNNADFFFTIKSKKNCGKDYQSPLYKALELNTENNITLCREKPAKVLGANGKPKAFKSYGVLDFQVLNQIWKSNNHLYEVIRPEHKPYFDIEFRFIDQEQKQPIFDNIINLLKSSFEYIGVPIDFSNDVAICENIGIGESGLFGGLSKASYHVIINNGLKFISHTDSNKFSKYLQQRITLEHEFENLIMEEGIAIDLKVYNKNRCFKLPYQSKANSTRIQLPSQRQELTDFLISYNLKDYQPINTDKIVLTFDAKTARVKGASGAVFSGNWNWSAIEEFKNTMVNANYTVKIEREPSHDIDYLVDSIYNGPEVSFKTWFCVGSAIKRAMNDDVKALELFTKWTQKYDPYATTQNLKDAFHGFSSSACGLKTLISLGRLCNPDLDLYCDGVHKLLFKTNKMPADIIRVEVNKRYLDFADIIPNFSNNLTIADYLAGKRVEENKCQIKFRPQTIFIKSAMGTGKTFNFINFIKLEESRRPIRVIYLSSRQAFAESTSADFESIKLASYLKHKHDISKFEKVIISLESIDKLSDIQINENDLLVIDEAESIFNIFSSSTLINAKYVDKIKIFMTLIKKSKMVFTMDAFLSNRSISAVMACREFNNTNAVYYINDFKYEERRYNMYKDEEVVYMGDKQLNKAEDQMLYTLKQKLMEGKRCCLVTGSSKFGYKVIENVKSLDKSIKFYNSANPLSLTVNVNHEWAECDLLIYSPTITCGISYTNADKPYDCLFIYAVNIGSCHFRDIIQATRRIRHFNDPEIKIALNTRYHAFNNEQYPIFIDEIKEIYHNHKKALFGDIPINSLLDNTEIAWLYDIHCFNIMEKNIHSIYLDKVAKHFFELENIVPNEQMKSGPLSSMIEIENPEWNYKMIRRISRDEFEQIGKKLKQKTNSLEEEQEYFKYIFDSKTDYIKKQQKMKNDAFNFWCSDDKQRQYMLNIIDFNKFVKLNSTIQRNENDLEMLEFYNTDKLAYKHLYDILSHLKIIKKSADEHERHYIDIYARYNTLDLEVLVEKYKQLNSKAINQLFDDHYLNTKSGTTNFTTKTMTAIINKLLKDKFGFYEMKKVDEYRKSVNGKKRDISEYAFQVSAENQSCLFDLFKS